MQFQCRAEAIRLLNEFGQSGEPFFMFVDYAGVRWYVARLAELDPRIKYCMPRHANYTPTGTPPECYKPHELVPPRFEDYARGFDEVQRAISRGETKLINLTWRVPFVSDFDQATRFALGRERYMLSVEGLFSVFSPEPFITIEGDRISTFPMKGTISTSVANAREVLLSSDKELREHTDSVELMREDLSLVSDDVEVVRFRYVEEIAQGRVLQTSSELSGTLRAELRGRYGDIISRLLPGGSIAGAPKAPSLEVIRRAEAFDRGFYTGIFGVYDGTCLDTSVMIRFIEYAEDGQTYFFGGGGVTAYSRLESEYQELLLKAHATILY